MVEESFLKFNRVTYDNNFTSMPDLMSFSSCCFLSLKSLAVISGRTARLSKFSHNGRFTFEMFYRVSRATSERTRQNERQVNPVCIVSMNHIFMSVIQIWAQFRWLYYHRKDSAFPYWSTQYNWIRWPPLYNMLVRSIIVIISYEYNVRFVVFNSLFVELLLNALQYGNIIGS